MDDVETQPVARGRRILVVDDVPANLVAMEAALAPLNRQLVTATSGRQALGQVLEQHFSLVLIDVQMPDMDGFETATLIRSCERSKHRPIIFITAHDEDPAQILRAYRLGAVDFLFKPVDPEILLAKAAVFVTLDEHADALAGERLRHEFEVARSAYEAEALHRRMDMLAETDRRKDAFLAVLAHELRNPLAPIRIAIDLFKSDPDEGLSAKTIDIIDRQTMHLARLVDDLLDVSRIKANKIELRREPHDLREIVQDAVATTAPTIELRSHQISVELGATPVHVLVDPMRISQVVTNLLTNAARYTDPGGRIEVTCSIEADSARVRVSDTGIGIPEELIDSIFEMFVQERVRSDGSGGLGLGLALARQLVELHGGTIHAQSPGPGLGSTFDVRLPLASAREVSE